MLNTLKENLARTSAIKEDRSSFRSILDDDLSYLSEDEVFEYLLEEMDEPDPALDTEFDDDVEFDDSVELHDPNDLEAATRLDKSVEYSDDYEYDNAVDMEPGSLLDQDEEYDDEEYELDEVEPIMDSDEDMVSEALFDLYLEGVIDGDDIDELSSQGGEGTLNSLDEIRSSVYDNIDPMIEELISKEAIKEAVRSELLEAGEDVSDAAVEAISDKVMEKISDKVSDAVETVTSDTAEDIVERISDQAAAEVISDKINDGELPRYVSDENPRDELDPEIRPDVLEESWMYDMGLDFLLESDDSSDADVDIDVNYYDGDEGDDDDYDDLDDEGVVDIEEEDDEETVDLEEAFADFWY